MQLLDVKESDGTATSEVLRTFVIDTTGPTITQRRPAPGEIVGGVVTDLRHGHATTRACSTRR